jgi:hypothetical protein
MNELVKTLQDTIVDYLLTYEDRPYLKNRSGKSYTTHETAAAVRDDTEFGREVMTGVVRLATNMLITNKEELAKYTK